MASSKEDIGIRKGENWYDAIRSRMMEAEE
jgi:hypothetical protein